MFESCRVHHFSPQEMVEGGGPVLEPTPPKLNPHSLFDCIGRTAKVTGGHQCSAQDAEAHASSAATKT